MAKVRKRTWTNKSGEQTAWIADYDDQDGKRQKKAAQDWLSIRAHSPPYNRGLRHRRK
jgi:hypothetical protein